MKLSTKTYTFTAILLSVFVFLGYALYKCHQANRKLRSSLPYLTVGESIHYFNLIGMDETRIDQSNLEKDRPVLIFIFSRPCSPCDKNLVYWKKMAEIFKEDVSVYGIILGKLTEAYNFSETSRLNFNIYVPEDAALFIREMRIKLNFSQTIIYSGKVRYVRLGEMNGEEAVGIIKTVKGMI